MVSPYFRQLNTFFQKYKLIVKSLGKLYNVSETNKYLFIVVKSKFIYIFNVKK